MANAVFTGDELNDLSCGAPLEITLSAESKATVTDSEKAAIDAKLQADSTVGMHLDINIYKGFKNYEAEQVAELNKVIDLSVDLPENLVNTQSGVKREYSVVRMHNGVAEIIPCTYDETTKTLEFSSDKFSTYTIVYTDKSESGNIGESGVGEAEKEPDRTENNKTETNQTTSPLTGDSSDVNVWTIVGLVCALTVAGLVAFKKQIIE